MNNCNIVTDRWLNDTLCRYVLHKFEFLQDRTNLLSEIDDKITEVS